jgi:hypothetical protein
MPDLIKFNDGTQDVIFDMKDFLMMLEVHLGSDARKWLETYLEGEEDTELAYVELEKELESEKDHTRDVLLKLQTLSCEINGILRKRKIDWEALSAAAGKIGNRIFLELGRYDT